ncbi:hypothetical protein R1flu_012152 [Riccia fluitans]|uniref:Maturase K n=1 Tax=Riccia fluitans TaxID=41844 RepID=A0ABD1Z9S9_9MARC
MCFEKRLRPNAIIVEAKYSQSSATPLLLNASDSFSLDLYLLRVIFRKTLDVDSTLLAASRKAGDDLERSNRFDPSELAPPLTLLPGWSDFQFFLFFLEIPTSDRLLYKPLERFVYNEFVVILSSLEDPSVFRSLIFVL